ncbi:LEA type 2 family protein [Pseudomonas sp. P66]|jgi:LEA14-like dessication related protein|uniref:LEA type 2 family protein n=1 Tax=Pseudomonas arcuscaelestis TaxID=2710591 RepID=A0ABS2C0H4_9PSED|nr:LEA type 2 family protein [Pseudomonas arcuscaelestis]MBM3113114.1 LEA type 2 family protein [Pseudomonas arcuscaelestis]MBM5459354.1 LEA type 2 family protein [Pseudomonas arcuscaelestis]
MILVFRRLVHLCLVLTMLLGLVACAVFQDRDPVNISVIGIEPLPGQDLELRMAVKLRVQNPNESAIDYNGIALNLEVNGQPLAAGVSDQSGSIGRFGESVLVVPVSITAFSVLRQAVGLGKVQNLDGLPYVVRGKLAAGLLGTRRFSDSGRLDLPAPARATW